MAWPNIDPGVPTGSEKKKFGDDRIRETKGNLVDALEQVSNYSAAGSTPALRTAVWTTATRPTGADLVDRVSGFNNELGYEEYYDAVAALWKAKGAAYGSVILPQHTTTTRPVGVAEGYTAHCTDLDVIERWDGSAWKRVNSPARGDICMWSGSVADIATKKIGWVLCDGGTHTIDGEIITVPDLRRRFIVGAGQDGGTYTPGVDGVGTGHYAPGATGGEDKHVLTVEELAGHTHTMTRADDWEWTGSYITPSGHTSGAVITSSETGGDEAHENRPPYYALCFLYKL